MNDISTDASWKQISTTPTPTETIIILSKTEVINATSWSETLHFFRVG